MQLLDSAGFEWNNLTVSIDDLPEPLHGLRIVHLSDLHLRPGWRRGWDELIEQVTRDVPDLIVISGDFVEHRADYRKTLPTLERLLMQLRARLGIYGILGNHDGDLLGPKLAAWGVQDVSGRTARLESRDAALEVVGVPSVSRLDSIDAFVASIPPRDMGVPRLVLSHFPDSIRKLESIETDLVLCGHTHGGQCCLPGCVPIITHDSLPRRLSKGVHEIAGGKVLVVNRGLGFATLPLRVFCPAEVIEIRLLSSTTPRPIR